MNIRTISLFCTVLAAVFNCSTSVHAEKVRPGLVFSQAVGASYNPLGLIVDSRLLYTSPFINKPGILWESTRTRVGVQNEWTPADNLFSLRAEWEPIAFFDVTAKAGYFSMFNALGYGCIRLTDAHRNPYDAKTVEQIDPDNARGYWMSITPTLKARAGKFILLNTLSLNRIHINGQGGFLELHSFLPRKTTDTDIANGTIALYEASGKLLAGASFKNTYVYGSKRLSRLLSGVAIFKDAPSAPRNGFLLASIGVYFLDPLFTGVPYCAVLAGRDFQIH